MKVLRLLRAVAVPHAVVVCLQPLLAGLYLNGSGSVMRLHEAFGLAAGGLAALQLLLAAAWWRSPAGSGGPALLAAGVLAAEAYQLPAGFDRQLSLHVPLGVAIVIGSVTLAYRVTRRTAVAA